MEELKELLNTSLTGRITGVETFNQFTESKKSLVYKLYSNISAGKINTDADAREVLYGKNYSGKKYDVLKKRFKEKLYTNILFIQPREKNKLSYAHNLYFVHKHYIVGKVLLMAAARWAGRIVLKNVLKKAQYFEVTEIAILTALRLKKEAAIIGDWKQHEKFVKLFHRYSEILQAETQAEDRYETLVMHFARSYKARPDLIPQAKDAFTYIEALKNTYGTFLLHQTSFQAYIFYSDLCDDYYATLQACQAFENYLIAKPQFYSRVRHGNIIIHKLNCFLYLGQYLEGLQLAAEGLKMYESKEGNWLVLQEIHFLIALRAQNYILAAEVFEDVWETQKRNNIDDRQKEMWRIYSGYLSLCIVVEKGLHQYKKHSADTAKGIGRLINETPIYTKDKEGINLSLFILQLCLLLQKKEFKKATDKIEQLKSYIYKYIHRKEGARENAFLKLILLLQKYNFDAELLEAKAQNYLKKLSNTTNVYNAYKRNRIEVLPYYTTWKILLKILGDRRQEAEVRSKK